VAEESNLLDLEKEKACLVREVLVCASLMVLKGTIESKQYLSFIKIIITKSFVKHHHTR